MTRQLIFTIFDKDGKNLGGWHRPRGATPRHRAEHLMLDKHLVTWHKSLGHSIFLRRA